MLVILFLLAIVGGFAFWANRKSKAQLAAKNQAELDDAIADARRWIERLGSQVLSLSGTDAASTQAIADASERYNAASSQISTANTAKQAKLARESALEGLYYINAARGIMGMPPGPELPLLEGQKQAGKVMEQRTVEYEGQQITASPVATAETPNYYPGGTVAGRPVPAGWYSQPWWMPALTTGVWAAGSALLFSSLFHRMAGVGPSLSAALTDDGDFDMPDIPEASTGDGDGDGGGFFDGLFGDGGIFDFGGDGDGGGLFDFGGDGDGGGSFDF